MFHLITHHKHLISSDVPEEHFEKMSSILQKIIPEELCFEDICDFSSWMKDTLPLIKWDEFSPSKRTITISLLCLKNTRLSIDVLLPELLKQRLLPGREVSILSFNHMYFHHNHLREQVLFIGAVTILLDSPQERLLAIENLPILEQEIKSAIHIPTQGVALLAKKVHSLPTNIAAVQHKLTLLLRKFPHDIDESIFEDMDRLFVLSHREFLYNRNPNHISRLITSIYILQKNITVYYLQRRPIPSGATSPIPANLTFPFCVKPVLGCLIGIGRLQEHEILEERHLSLLFEKSYQQ